MSSTNLVSFLDICIHVLQQIWKIFSINFSNTLCSFLSLCSFWDSHKACVGLPDDVAQVPHGQFTFLPTFFFLPLRFNNCHCYSFNSPILPSICSNPPLNSCNKFFISVTVFLGSKISFWFLFRFYLYGYLHFVHILLSLSQLSPCLPLVFLSILKTVAIKSLPSRSSSGLFQGQSVCISLGHTFLSLYMHCDSVVENSSFESNYVVTMTKRFSFHRVCCFEFFIIVF